MTVEELKERNLERNVVYSGSRSSGPGGQNVNKVNTRIELRLDIVNSPMFSEEEKTLILTRLKRRINSAGELLLTSQSERTQQKNREAVTERLYRLLADALTVRPERKSTLPTVSSREERLEVKKRHSQIKKLRRDQGEISE
ncbi:MAG: alternative ribosome rescue aminoacyl-tRNA hydrolase ArfB [Bacteroidales bacterium]|jgi:ribosome-associated protein|nr:alternative ribosome rescue aminoacyl-tRNA hydrolase ArfB [Bacteroidales bacterium]